MTEKHRQSAGFSSLPTDLPVPEDDGAASHLAGASVPSVLFRSTSGADVDLASVCSRLALVYVYPRTGTPGRALPAGWDQIPGARGCTVQNCAFRDHAAELRELGADVVGISAQPFAEQEAFASRERIPYPLLNDDELRLAEVMGLPTFEADGMQLYRRLTFLARDGRMDRVLYPVFPPGSDVDVAFRLAGQRKLTAAAAAGTCAQPRFDPERSPCFAREGCADRTGRDEWARDETGRAGT